MSTTAPAITAAILAEVLAAVPDVQPSLPFVAWPDGRDMRTVADVSRHRHVQIVPGPARIGQVSQGDGLSVAGTWAIVVRYWLAERSLQWLAAQEMWAADSARLCYVLSVPGTALDVAHYRIELAPSTPLALSREDPRVAWGSVPISVHYVVADTRP